LSTIWSDYVSRSQPTGHSVWKYPNLSRKFRCYGARGLSRRRSESDVNRTLSAAPSVTLTPEQFIYAFVNTFSEEQAAAACERYAVPETGQIFYEAGFANFHLHPPTEVHFKNEDRAPLLIVGAAEDHTVPASLSRAQYKRYEHSAARTDYLEFEGRPHFH